jgi:D-methionine transport system ATP-binding protein
MIDVENLEKTFNGPDGPAIVLQDVSFSVPQGEIFGIIGRSGAGKSTLVRCINLLERPTGGRVFIDGLEITALAEAPLRRSRRGIGMIFQHFNLLSSRTAYENVAFPLELAGKTEAEIRREVEPLLDLVGLAEKRDQYPAELSGGQKQRVGIARALASRPSVLLCDEATSALDPETTKSILALLKDINVKLGLTIILITHEMPVIKEICDRVAVLDHGRIVELGRVFDVFTAPEADVTRGFVRDVVDRELPTALVEQLRSAAPNRGNPVLRIIFTGPSASSPIIAEVVRKFDVLLNILQGNVEYIQSSPYGNIIVEAIGPHQAVQNAIDFIRANNLSVEVLGHVAANDRVVV